jgi:hypothetical protein
LALGVLHLIYTFSGKKLTPRDPALQVRMAEVPPVITRQTTMWGSVSTLPTVTGLSFSVLFMAIWPSFIEKS